MKNLLVNFTASIILMFKRILFYIDYNKYLLTFLFILYFFISKEVIICMINLISSTGISLLLFILGLTIGFIYGILYKNVFISSKEEVNEPKKNYILMTDDDGTTMEVNKFLKKQIEERYLDDLESGIIPENVTFNQYCSGILPFK